MAEYSLLSLTKTSNVLKFHMFSICFLRLILYIKILMCRNLDFFVQSVSVVSVLSVFALMLFFFRQKIVAIFGRKKY